MWRHLGKGTERSIVRPLLLETGIAGRVSFLQTKDMRTEKFGTLSERGDIGAIRKVLTPSSRKPQCSPVYLFNGTSNVTFYMNSPSCLHIYYYWITTFTMDNSVYHGIQDRLWITTHTVDYNTYYGLQHILWITTHTMDYNTYYGLQHIDIICGSQGLRATPTSNLDFHLDHLS